MLNSHQENSPLLLEALFCEEEHWDWDWDEREREDDESFSESQQGLISEHWDCDEEEMQWLLKKEQECEVYNVFDEKPCVGKAREEAVEWMLKVIEYYSFSALTAVLAVNYLDRFLYNFRSDQPWMTQLAAVACLSLAAKVDEIQVPLLLDLQVEEPKYVFEAKNIKRMEVLVLSTLQWKMNPVTPLSFLDYFTRRLPLYISSGFLTRCHRLILSLISDSRFMAYLPSALASASMLFVLTTFNPNCIALDVQHQLLAILGINKEKVHDCCLLIQQVATLNSMKKRKFGCLPCSPKGVFDASFSSDNSNDSWALISSSSVSSSPEPLFKKIKFHESPNTSQ